MKVVTAAEMREIDRAAIEDYGIPPAVLMNSAGRFVAEIIKLRFPGSAVHVVCGTGNNGGDGFTAAYYLFNAGFDVKVCLCGTAERLSPVSKIFMNMCVRSGIHIQEFSDVNEAGSISFDTGIIIDAIFGTGITGSPSGLHLEFINKINNSGLKVISADIPSGLPSDGGIPDAPVVKAHITITIGLPKISISTCPGRNFCGEVITADIGFPHVLTQSENLKVSLIDYDLFRTAEFFSDTADMHKGSRGHTLLCGGFTGMEGAILLAAKSLFRTGAGLATVITTVDSRQIIAGRIPELMTDSIPDDDPLAFITQYTAGRKFNLLLIGPGMGRTEFASKVFSAFIESAHAAGISRILIDGDGLYHLSEYLKRGALPAGPVYCITPHFMEASRLTGIPVDNIKANRLKTCIELAAKTGCTVVLKGPATIVSDGNLSFINTTGNSRLATAGSGDVLSGIIASLMNRTQAVSTAAACGVFLHGLCSDIFAAQNQVQLMKAGDIIRKIPQALSRIYIKGKINE